MVKLYRWKIQWPIGFARDAYLKRGKIMGVPIFIDDPRAQLMLSGFVRLPQLTPEGAKLVLRNAVEHIRATRRFATMPKVADSEYASHFNGFRNYTEILERRAIYLMRKHTDQDWELFFLGEDYGFFSVILRKTQYGRPLDATIVGFSLHDFVAFMEADELGLERVYHLLKQINKVMNDMEQKLRFRVNSFNSHRTAIVEMIEANERAAPLE